MHKTLTFLRFILFFTIPSLLWSTNTKNQKKLWHQTNMPQPFELRINSGGGQMVYGDEIFEADKYFSGNGKSFVNNKISDIKETVRDEIYLSERSTKKNLQGFSYAVPLENGTYTLKLHFAEIWFGATGSGPNGNGKRVFSVEMEGNTILSNFDINKEVGTMTAVVKTYEVTVNDGILNLDFSASVNQPKLSALEILGEVPEPTPPNFVKRINSGGGQLNFGEVVFEADQSFNGDPRTYSTSKINDIAGTDYDALYKSERSPSSDAAEFGYAIPLDNGDYTVKLHFAEIYFGATGGGPGGTGKRIFNVEMEGSDVLVDFDINAEVGSMRAVVKSFPVNIADGELNMRFYSSVNRPKLSGIEIFGEEPIVDPVELKLLARINSGGSQVTTQGIVFEADTYHHGGGKPYTNNKIADIKETNLDAVYKTERSTLKDKGSFGYAIPVTNGEYSVNLHFAEIYFGATGGGSNGNGKRIFDVLLEGQPILVDYDINKDVGTMTATVKTFETSVTDGELNLDFSASVNQPKLSALEVFGTGEIVATAQPCGWSELAASSADHIEGQSATVNGKLYIFSGFDGAIDIVNATEIYDPNSDSWAIGAPMPQPVTHGGMTAVNNEVWIIGGFAGDNPGVATDRVQIYNTSTDTWRDGIPLPEKRGSGAAAFNNGKVHFFGGLMPDRKTDVGDHYVFDIANADLGWQSAAPMPNPRNHLGGTSANGIIYAVGGQVGHDGPKANQKFVHAYDPLTDSWSRLQDLPTIRSHFEVGTISHNGKVLIAGGNNGADDILEYDPDTNEWTEFCKLPEALLTPVAMVSGDKLIITGGGAPNNYNPTHRTRWVPIEPEADALNFLKASSVSLDLDQAEVQAPVVYPNPVSNLVQVQFSNRPQTFRITVKNISGNLLQHTDFKSTTEASFLLDQPAGLYFMTIQLDSGEKFVHKVLKL